MKIKKVVLGLIGLFLMIFCTAHQGFAQEEKAVRVAIEAVRAQMRVPKEIEIKIVERKESPIPDFYSVKLFLLAPDREIPGVAYVDKTGEKGYDPKAYQAALETGNGRKRGEEDLALGNKLRVKGTPMTLINGEMVRNPVTDPLLNQSLQK
jgi:hypothetical protein